MARAGSGTRSKPPWPRLPLIEDEVRSLSREHSPELPGLVEAEAQMRGTVDQTPIIVEANPGAFARAAPPRSCKHGSQPSSLRSQSSSESLEPHTPPDASTTNADRRYVWQPEKDIHIPVSYDDPPPLKKVTTAGPKEPDGASDGQARKEAPVLDQKPSRQVPRNLSPLITARDPSPYAYSPASSKPASGSSRGPASMLSPDAKSGNGEVRNRHYLGEENGPNHHYQRMRAQSANAMERPAPARSTSGAGYAIRSRSPDRSRLTPTSPQPPYAWSTSQGRHDSSDESDVSPDEYRSTVKRATRYSSSPLEQARPSVASRYEGKIRHSRQNSQRSGMERPSNRSSGSFDRLPPQDHRSYSTSVPNTAPLPRSARRNTSPRASLYPSPDRSPPLSPRPDAHKHSLGSFSYASKTKYHDRPTSPISFAGRRPKPTSRPPSPLPSPQLPQGSQFDAPDPGYMAKPSPLGIPLPRSRQTSPLPSPTPDSPLKATSSRVDHSGPSSSKSKTSVPSAESALRPPRDAPTPTVTSPPGYLTTPGGPQRRTPSALDTSAVTTDAEPQRRSFDAPPSPVRSRTATSLPTVKAAPAFHEQCRRSMPTARYDDWSSIPECPVLNICPDCRRAIEDHGYQGRFLAHPPRAPGQKIRCDVSNGYVSQAWAQIVRGTATTTLLTKLMAVERDEHACPGKHHDVRLWYRVWEPESERYITDFTICACCARRIELLFPTLKATVLHPLAGRHASICDLRPDSHRFARYLDTLARTDADADLPHRPPNLYAFVRLARRMADTRECLRDDQLLHATWHFPAQLPDFTVCAECFDAVVAPRRDAGDPVALALAPSPARPPHHHTGALSCQLYSARMRAIFADACARRDFARLSSAVLHRVAVERDLQAKMARLPPEQREGDEAVALVREWKRWE